MINKVCICSLCSVYYLHLQHHNRSALSTAMDVYINRCLDNIVAGGVQISGLHATVAPRRQQLQSSPTLEEFVFTPYVDRECLRDSRKHADQLRLCKGTINSCFVVVTYTQWLLHWVHHAITQSDPFCFQNCLNSSCSLWQIQCWKYSSWVFVHVDIALKSLSAAHPWCKSPVQANHVAAA